MSAARNQLDGTVLCVACGNTILATDETCPKCLTPQGYKAKNGSQPAPKANRATVAAPKSKTAAVLLAVFLSYWTWLYTYKASALKFWIAVGVSVLIAMPLTIANGSGFLITLAIQIWAIIDVAVKPSDFYTGYRK